jgi:hypothetical protein
MKMKLLLYIGFFVVFTFVFTQIAFPLSAKVKAINQKNARDADSIAVFKDIKENVASNQNENYEYLVKGALIKDIRDHHFINYEIGIESTRLISIRILNSKITVNDKYKNRVILRTVETYEKEVSATKTSNKKFKLLVDINDMSHEEIQEMIRNIDIHVTWKVMPGWERVNKVYLPEGIIAY